MQIGFTLIGIVFSLVGITLILIGIFAKQKPKFFFDNALQAEATVIDVGIRQTRPFKIRRFSEPAYTAVTIEFMTKSCQSVQGDIDTNLTLFYSGQYKIGDKVNLLYNPEKPTEFIVTSLQSTKTTKLIMIVTGLFLMLTGIGLILLTNPLNFLYK